MVVLDATIVNVALPSIQEDLDVADADLQWIVNSYTLIFGGFLLLGGRAGDILGRKRLFLVGLVIFTVASLLNGLADSPGVLIVGRGLQGLGAAFVAPAALSILTTTFAEGPQRTKAMGVWAGIATGGAAIGLLLGGILTEYFSWPWIFFVNIPVGIAAFLLSLRYVPESRAAPEHRIFDVPGAVTVTAGLIALVYGIVNVQSSGWTSPQHDRLRRRRGDPAHRLRPDRAAAARPARPPRHLPRAHDPRRQRLDAPGRIGVVRDVLLQHALRPAHPRLLAAPGGSRVPPRHGRHRHRRRALAGRRQAARRPHDVDHRDVDRDLRDAVAADDAT